MKKYFYSILAASMLFACSQEEVVDVPANESQQVTITVELPSIESRAIADGVEVGKGNMANTLVYAMYEEDQRTGEPLVTDFAERGTDGKFKINVPMAKNLKYDLLFLAYNEDEPIFDIKGKAAKQINLNALTLRTDLKANQESYDAFVGVLDSHSIQDANTVTLTRPFAQVNAVTTSDDLNAVKDLKSEVTTSKLVITAPNTYNVFTGEATNPTSLTYETSAILQDIALADKTEAYPKNEKFNSEYYYLTLAYVLAGEGPNATASNHNAVFEFYRQDKKLVSKLDIVSLPLQRNYRTNVMGSLLTKSEDYTITIDADFGEKDIMVDETGAMVVATEADLQEALAKAGAGAVIKLGSDITLTETLTIPAGKVITLDLNGKQLTVNEPTTNYAINNLGTLTLKDSSVESRTTTGGSISARGIYNGYGNGGENVTTAKIIVESGTYNAMGTNGGAAIFNYGIAEIKGGKFTSIGGYSLNNQLGATMIIDNAEVTGGIYNVGALTINDGKIKTDRGDYTHAIYHDGSSLTINDGEFQGNGNEVVNANSSEATINGGTFKKVDKTSYLMAGSKMVINGGTFLAHDSDPAAHPVRPDVTVKGGTFNYKHTSIADGYSIVENGDGTWTVSRTPLSLDGFLAALEASNYNYDGTGVKVVLKDSEFNWYNNTVRQYYIPASGVNINSNVESFTIKNVTFTFEDDDTSNNYTAGELQTLAKNVTFESCTFENVSVSPWETTTGANDCASATFTDCTWKNLSGRYGVHQSKAASLSVTGCTFDNCQRGIHVNTVANLTVKGNTFTGIGDGYGVLCLSEGITTALTSMDVSGNIAEGQTMLRQLSKVITYEQVCSIFANNTYGNEYVAGSIIVKDPAYTYLTSENYSSTTLESNTKYMLEGDFGSKNVSLKMAADVENVVFDGSNATNINELIITQNGQLIDNANDVVGERSGKVTIQNFNVLSQINVFACKTEVVVQNNTAEALMIHAGNCAVKVLNNTIDGNFESHPTYKDATNTWNNNDYGIALNIFEYNLWLDGNTVTDSKSHAIGINGWEGTFDTGNANKIESFKNNRITVNSTAKTERAALKIWDDETYASNDEATDKVNETAQAFIDAVLADNSNTFTIAEGYDHTIFCFYNVNTNN